MAAPGSSSDSMEGVDCQHPHAGDDCDDNISVECQGHVSDYQDVEGEDDEQSGEPSDGHTVDYLDGDDYCFECGVPVGPEVPGCSECRVCICPKHTYGCRYPELSARSPFCVGLFCCECDQKHHGHSADEAEEEGEESASDESSSEGEPVSHDTCICSFCNLLTSSHISGVCLPCLRACGLSESDEVPPSDELW